MHYSDEAALKEILKRKEQVSRKRRAKSCRNLAAASAVLFVALIAVITVFPKGMQATPAVSIYGSILLGREAGGYILASLLAFLLGIAVALFCVRYRQQHDKDDTK